MEGKDWKKELNTFLRNYWATPNAMMGVSPAKIMFGRAIRTRLPEFTDSEKSAVLDGALACNLRHKAKMKQHSDKRNRSMPSNVVERDMVLLKQPKTNKMSMTFDPNPYRVGQRQGTSVHLKHGQEPTIMQNVSWTRKIDSSSDQDQKSTDDEDGEDSINEQPLQQESAPVVNTRPMRACRPPARMQDFLT